MLTSTRSSITSSGNVTKVSGPDLSPVQNFGLGFGPNLEGSVSVSVSRQDDLETKIYVSSQSYLVGLVSVSVSRQDWSRDQNIRLGLVLSFQSQSRSRYQTFPLRLKIRSPLSTSIWRPKFRSRGQNIGLDVGYLVRINIISLVP